MKCNKCGTPIIPGEATCRICGNKADFSKRVKEPEIIDFPDEIEEKVEIKEEVNELPDLVDIVDIKEPTVEEVQPTVELPQADLEQTMSLEPEVVETVSEEACDKVEEVPVI